MIEVVKMLVMTLILGRVLSSKIRIIGDFNFSVCLQGEWMIELDLRIYEWMFES